MQFIQRLQHPWLKANLKAKLVLMISAVTVVSLILSGAFIFSYEISRAKKVSAQDMLALAEITASTSTAALVFSDRKSVNEYLGSLNRRSDVVAACIYDANNQIFGKFTRAGSPIECPSVPGNDGTVFDQNRILKIFEPIQFENRRIGTIFIASNLGYLRNELVFQATLITSVLIIATAFALLLSGWVQRYVSNPIQSLAKTAKVISKNKDYSTRMLATRHDEIGYLIDAFNTMLEQIESQNTEQERLLRETQEAVRMRDEFMSIASHELKTPLTPLRIQVQILQRLSKTGQLKQYPPDKLEALMNFTDNQLKRLVSLIEDLLDITRITSGKLHLHLEDVQLASLIQEILTQHRRVIRHSGSQVRTELDESIVAHWDRSRIEQVLVNLLTNALKYGSGKEIHITTQALSDRVVISVQDQGIGIAEEDRSRIFGRFERAVSMAHYGGLGLGLYISNQIIMAHGGTIRVESKIGHGSNFIVELPWKVSAVAA